MDDMTRQVFAECVEEMTERAHPTPGVDAATRQMRRLRAEQLDEVDAVVNGGAFYAKGFRSPTDWLVVTTCEGVGFCKLTLHLADRIQRMPIVRAAFAGGGLAESSLRLLAGAWAETIADVFERDEQMLCEWATAMPHADFKLVLDTWRMHADPDREAATAQEQFDRRALHLSRLLDGVGVVDGVLDPEGFALVREAIRLYAQPVDGETRLAAQRRADALVTIARMAIESHVPVPGAKRRKPKVVATISYDDLVSDWYRQQDPTTDRDTAPADPQPDAGPGAEDPRPDAGPAGDPQPDTGPADDPQPDAGTPGDDPRPETAEPRSDEPSPRPGEPAVRPWGGSLDTDTDRTIVSADTIRRMACDCNIHRYITNPLGTVIDYARTTRVVSDTLFDVLVIRDHGCRWPGCGIPAGGCDAHHATHWLDGGHTKPDNLVLLCWFHHHLLHEQHWSIEPLGGGHFNLNNPHHGDVRLLRPPLVGAALPTTPPTHPVLPDL